MSFSQECYALLEKIPKGRVTTYKEIAKALNSKAYRAVGNAMHNNKNPIKVPCHRVVRADGKLGNYLGGTDKKAALLKAEGVEVKEGKIVDFEEILYRF